MLRIMQRNTRRKDAKLSKMNGFSNRYGSCIASSNALVKGHNR